MRDRIIHVHKWSRSQPPTEAELEKLLRDEGLEPYRWENEPGHVYNVHSHDYHKVIYVVSGSITFGFAVEGEPTTLYVGDRLDLPEDIPHNAAVGPDGVVCLEARKQF